MAISNSIPTGPPDTGLTAAPARVVIVQSVSADAQALAGFFKGRQDEVWQTTQSADASLLEARTWGQTFFRWYNYAHHHTALGLMTPAAVHTGQATQLYQARQTILTQAYAAHPERFVRGLPQPPALPAVVWLNPPPPEEKARSDTAQLH